MSHVEGSVVWSIARICEVGGYSPQEVIAAAELGPADVRAGKKVHWSQCVALMERIGELAGDDATLMHWSRSFADMVPAAVRVAFAATLSPKAMWKFNMDVIRWSYPAFRVERVSITQTSLEFSTRVVEGFAETRSGLLMMVGSMAGAMRHLGLPDAAVSWDLKPRLVSIRLEISAQPSLRSRLETVGDVIRGAVGLRPPGSEMAPPRPVETTLQESPRERALRLATADWELTPRQSEVVALLLGGAANKEIAQTLDCAHKTAEHHVSAVIHAAKCQTRGEVSSALWQLADGYESGYMPGGE